MSAADPRPDSAVARAHRVGVRAAQALSASGGWIVPLTEWPDAPYAEAAGEIVWLGSRPRTAHPRMVTAEIALPLRGALRIDASQASLWQPAPATLTRPTQFRSRLESICRRLGDLSPRGFAAVLAGLPAPFPLDFAAQRLVVLARAHAAGDNDRIVAASDALLGLGTGLTPAGDDVVGGALFGARLMGRDVEDVRAAIAAAAAHRTHRLSAALLDDLARGQTYGVLHDVVQALDSDEPPAGAVSYESSLANLTAIGHSSGWDIFTGLAIGVLGDSLPLRGNQT